MHTALGLVRFCPEWPGSRPDPPGSAWPGSKPGWTRNSRSVRYGPERKLARFGHSAPSTAWNKSTPPTLRIGSWRKAARGTTREPEARRPRAPAVEATVGRREATTTATATPSTPTIRPSPSSSFSPVIPSLSPSSSSSLPLGFLILDNEHDDLVLVVIRGAGTRDMD